MISQGGGSPATPGGRSDACFIASFLRSARLQLLRSPYPSSESKKLMISDFFILLICALPGGSAFQRKHVFMIPPLGAAGRLAFVVFFFLVAVFFFVEDFAFFFLDPAVDFFFLMELLGLQRGFFLGGTFFGFFIAQNNPDFSRSLISSVFMHLILAFSRHDSGGGLGLVFLQVHAPCPAPPCVPAPSPNPPPPPPNPGFGLGHAIFIPIACFCSHVSPLDPGSIPPAPNDGGETGVAIGRPPVSPCQGYGGSNGFPIGIPGYT